MYGEPHGLTRRGDILLPKAIACSGPAPCVDQPFSCTTGQPQCPAVQAGLTLALMSFPKNIHPLWFPLLSSLRADAMSARAGAGSQLTATTFCLQQRLRKQTTFPKQMGFVSPSGGDRAAKRLLGVKGHTNIGLIPLSSRCQQGCSSNIPPCSYPKLLQVNGGCRSCSLVDLLTSTYAFGGELPAQAHQ